MKDGISIGAIRWDAWVSPDCETRNVGASHVGAQVCRTLTPAKYHFRAPYFAKLYINGPVILPDYTQEQFDEEILMAADAGIDYFAYCWYSNQSEMSWARRFHTQSRYRNKVKLASISIPNDQEEMLELIELFQQDFYFKIPDGRPLLFVYTEADIRSKVNFVRETCRQKGYKQPYLALMGSSPAHAKEMDGNAISDYALFGDEIPFAQMAQNGRQRWERGLEENMDMIPCVSTGWDPRPRGDNPISWGGEVDHVSSVPTATPEEIVKHLDDCVQWIKAHEAACPAKALIIYAWNEHDEGGWLCPTVTVDEAGNPLQENGKNIPNNSRLQALKQYLSK